MKRIAAIFFFISFCSTAWTKSNIKEETVAEIVQDVVNRLVAAENSKNVFTELARAYLALESYEHSIKISAIETCRKKFGLKKHQQPERGSALEKCVTKCGFEEEGYWKNGRPEGIAKILKTLNDIVVYKFAEFDKSLTKEAVDMQKCYAIENENACEKVYDTMHCIRRSVDRISSLITDRVDP